MFCLPHVKLDSQRLCPTDVLSPGQRCALWEMKSAGIYSGGGEHNRVLPLELEHRVSRRG